MIDTTDLSQLDAPQLREMVRSLMGTVVARDREIAFKQATIDKITHEMAVLKRLKFAAKSEAFNAEQKSLLEETIDADLAALQAELDKVLPDEQSKGEKKTPKREKLPAKDFGLPEKARTKDAKKESGNYPMPDKAHARNAKSRAAQQRKAGNLTKAEEERIDRKADKKLDS